MIWPKQISLNKPIEFLCEQVALVLVSVSFGIGYATSVKISSNLSPMLGYFVIQKYDRSLAVLR